MRMKVTTPTEYEINKQKYDFAVHDSVGYFSPCTRKQVALKERSSERRYWLQPLLIVIAIVLFCIAVPRVLDRQGWRLRGGYIPDSEREDGVEQGYSAPTSTATPTATPTGTLTATETLAMKTHTVPMKSNRVYKVISPYIQDPDLLLDRSTFQGAAFVIILSEDNLSDFQIRQRFALMVLFLSTNGLDWDFSDDSNVFRQQNGNSSSNGWKTFSARECSWHGVECKPHINGYQSVTTLRLDGKNLNGVLPPEICLLRELEEVFLANNKLQGGLPLCISGLSNMRELNLESNQLSGSLPLRVFMTPSLRSLSLSNNRFDGSLDGFLFQYPAMESLEELNLQNNMFHGLVPWEIIKFRKLETLFLEGNDLTGDTTRICYMSTLSVFTVDCFAVNCPCCKNCDLFLGG